MLYWFLQAPLMMNYLTCHNSEFFGIHAFDGPVQSVIFLFTLNTRLSRKHFEYVDLLSSYSFYAALQM